MLDQDALDESRKIACRALVMRQEDLVRLHRTNPPLQVHQAHSKKGNQEDQQ